MAGGWNRKHYRVHELGGTVRQGRQQQRLSDLPASAFGVAKMPKWLDLEAKRFWRQHAPGLEANGCLTALDTMSFALVCSAWSHLLEAERIIAAEGAVIATTRGGLRAHPAVRQRTTWEKCFLAGAKDFGLSPLSRQRLPSPPPPAQVDHFAEFLSLAPPAVSGTDTDPRDALRGSP